MKKNNKFMNFEFSEYLEKEVRLADLGFFSLHKEKGNNFFRYIRKTENRIDLLGLNIYNATGHRSKEKGIFIGYELISQGVSFPIINEIIEEAKIEIMKPDWYDHNFYDREITLSIKHPNWKRPHNYHPSISKNLCTPNHQVDDVKATEACQILRQIIVKEILPFYEMYPDLKSVNDEIIMKYDMFQELSDYISGQIAFKKMVIMNLSNNPNYSSYVEEYEDKLRKGVQKDEKKYSPYLAFFLNLKKVLNKK